MTLLVAASTTAQPRPRFGTPLSPSDNTLSEAVIDGVPIRFESVDQKGAFVARTIGSSVRLNGRTIDFPVVIGSAGTNSIRVQFVGARRGSRLVGVDLLPGRVNYLYGQDRARWRTNVRTYARALTTDLYRGIDVLYYGAGDQLEYDLIVRPGAHPDSIRLAISGASVALSDAGDLVQRADGRVLLHKPIAHQTIAGERREVTAAYRIREDGTIDFAIAPYDHKQILVIDPIVAYSFSFGGSGDEQVYDIVADETGAVYVGGETYSPDFPTVSPAQPRQDAGNPCVFYGSSICRDAFLAKLAPDGKSLEYATYFGSADFDQVNHIAVDSAHALYFAGWTTTQTTSPQPDVRNSFIGKLAPDGSHFLYTYFTPRCCLSGPQLTINDLAIAPDGSAYVAVSTPATAEIAMLSATGDAYHAIYTLTDPSGISRTSFNAIAIRGDYVFVGGNTTWSGFPTTSSAPSVLRNGVLMRLSLTGSVVYSVFFNPRNAITITDVAVDRNDAVYIVGDESETDTTCNPSSDHAVVVASVPSDGVVSPFRITATPYPGNACLLPPVRIAVDDQGTAYTAACGYGLGQSESTPRAICNLWRVTPAQSWQPSLDVPGHRFTIDQNGTARWFAPITGQVSIVKMAARVSLDSLTARPSVARFATDIIFKALIPVAEDDIEATFWRYDAYGGWRQVQHSTAFGGGDLFATSGLFISYAWTPAWWDAGDHQVCVFVRLAGSSDQPQSACTNVTVTGMTPEQPPILPSAADFNADLRPDLIWIYSPTGELAMWNLGGGDYGERVLAGRYLNAPPLPAGWHVAGAADIDGDHQTDLVLQSDAGYLGAWLFSGPTLKGGMLLTPNQVADPNWQIRAVGDLNHDGHPDLIWQYALTGQVAFWLMNGTSAIGYVVPDVAAPGADWEVIGSGDSDRDGDRDIFWQHRSTGTLAVWRENGTVLLGGAVLPLNPGPQWRAVAVADLDGDAYSDIVLQNRDTRDLGAWYLRGTALKFGLLLVPSSVGSPGWSLVGPR